MQYYIDRNVDPLSSLHKVTKDNEKNTDDDGQIHVRRGYYSRSRSNDRYSNRRSHRQYESSSRSPIPRHRNHHRERLIDSPQLQDCKRSDTIGCPHFVKYHHMDRFIKSISAEYVRNTDERLERQRSRSRSVDSRRSTMEPRGQWRFHRIPD